MVTAGDSRPRVAPVKPEFVRPSVPRAVVEAVTGTGDGAQVVGAPKSRRQQQKVCAFDACANYHASARMHEGMLMAPSLYQADQPSALSP